MKALCIKSPWWEKIISGEKTIETRTWKTNHRGWIAICASKPTGAVVGFAKLVDCRPMTDADEEKACCSWRPYAWILEDVIAIKPLPVKGKLGLFDVDLLELGLNRAMRIKFEDQRPIVIRKGTYTEPGAPAWASKTADEILKDFETFIDQAVSKNKKYMVVNMHTMKAIVVEKKPGLAETLWIAIDSLFNPKPEEVSHDT